MVHIPVLQKEVIQYLDPRPNENFIDCTIGEGGHALAIIERILPKGMVLGIDWSPELIGGLKIKNQKPSPLLQRKGRGGRRERSSLRPSKIKNRLILVNDSYTNLQTLVEKYNFGPVSGILFDLGLSSWHLEKSGRGFSFRKDEPLDMRYAKKISNTQYPISNELTAEEIVNTWREIDIEKILREYGEEKFAKRISEKIVEERKLKPIKTTFQLVEIIKQATPSWYHHKKIHFATRTFQALRIVVNDELNNLKKVLPQTIEILKNGGRLVIISFHSLEDKIVKHFFKENFQKNLLQVLTKKPITPSKKEIKINPRSRSAKLRVAIKN